MYPEIRLKMTPKLLRKPSIDFLVTICAIIFLIVTFFSNPQSSSTTPYEAEYTYLETTRQKLLSDIPLTSNIFEKVTVTQITDGDTLKVKRADETEVSVRYIGIDTPEIKHQGNGEDELFGQEATALNEFLVKGKTVYLQKDIGETDKYGRLLRYVYLEDGTMVNYILIRLGYANIMTIPPNVAYQQKLFEGQELAKKEKRNLFNE
ncbi:thermonuclease family protein [bacterium]|nr:thermonuclease family protein [bacterium]